MAYEKILIVCVDRDADITSKAGIEGPVYGRADNIQAAMRLGLADPTESDTNTIFEAVRLFDYYQSQGSPVSIATLIGDERVGVISDEKIARQMDDAVEKFNPDGVVLVTDGAEDEFVLPILQSKTKIISMSRVIVKQSERLESTYYMLMDFLKEITTDPKLSRIIIGLPGISLILYMLWPDISWRLIGGIVGVFLVIKGFDLESAFSLGFHEFKSTYLNAKLSFFTYIVAGILFLAGIALGYQEVVIKGPFENILDTIVAVKNTPLIFLTIAIIVALFGKSIDAFVENESTANYLIMIVFILSIKFILDAIILFMQSGAESLSDLAVNVGLGIFFAIIAFAGIKTLKKHEQDENAMASENA